MTLPILNQPDPAQFPLTFPGVLDSTMLNSFRSCPEQFFRGYVHSIRPPGANVHLVAGAAFAAGLETARRAYFDEANSEYQSTLRGLVALTKTYGRLDPPEKYKNKAWNRVAGAYEAYFAQYPLGESIPPLNLMGKNCIEFTFALPLPLNHPVTGDPLILAGRTDMIGVRGESQVPYIVDEKTTGSLGDKWSEKWDLRAQFMCYAWAAREHGIHVAGAIVRGIAIRITGYDFAEAILFFPDWVIDRWYEQTLRDVKRMLACWHEGYWDYNLGETCVSYGGCAYAFLCKKQNPDSWLHYYEHHEWNPLERHHG